ncbi:MULTISPECIES: glycoside hydrolase family 38 C-terminal domain-containing protein [unclassified Frigoribacterium]|uniref:alpha-mannosidase n=1 Tax=unclassified Frigoribacterium TaxID=2627005 RepID=UPI0015669408|nr:MULTISPECIES: glycoside hydrolase family 38 C-terminal domain-containing protein [unclassified Frigoribacterium]NQW88001.1 alpha-mannosidase [Frigoribacterium sp. VKM Ac-2860]NQX09190.1 alpha-mannosidase [Frigoribacterium sp. VKM Ac-2859]
MHDNTVLVEARIDRFVRDRITPAVYRRAVPLTITAWEAPGEPVPFAEAVSQAFEPFAVGSPWSRPWGTTWFHVTGTVPDDLGTDPATALELVVDLGFSIRQPGFQAEGLVWRPDGTIVKAIEPYNGYVPLTAIGAGVTPGSTIDVYVEAASNPDIGGDDFHGETPLGDPETAGDAPIYALRSIVLAERDEVVAELDRDVWTLVGLMRTLALTSPRRHEILRALDRMCDVVDHADVAGTAAAGRAALADVLAAPANASAHRVVATGHAHIDSAWLWPVRETQRKVARTFSNVVALMDDDPDFVFAASSAQQYAWLKERYPELFARVAQKVAEGRFVPVGGMWVESDTNMPGGEALARQFVAGKGFFLREFGVDADEVWLPDSFGYTGAMPQIARAAGASSFFTQKESWNETNRMPHHTFLWEGIDGSRVFTHFPPVDTYNSDLSPAELAHAESGYAEKGFSNVSIVPFGWGDGGGGPTREMMAAARRAGDLEGSPRVTVGTPASFFAQARAELADPAVWSGEMYLEFHRGTYTSQARTKQGNRRSEHLLREAELWSATATARGLLDYPYDELEEIWHVVLLQQFHDILPGSSIAWVHHEAERHYARVAQQLEAIIGSAQRALAGTGSATTTFNAGPVPSAGVDAAAGSAAGRAQEAGVGSVAPVASDGGWVLDNGFVRAVFDGDGLVASLVDATSGRDLVAPGARLGLLQLFRDTPNQWDAWDVDQAYKNVRTDLVEAESVVVDGGALVVTRRIGDSTIVQRWWLDDDEGELHVQTEVDWHERQKLLKLAFPFDVHADRAASEVQFGHVQRPTHQNTSWDFARFETVAHRWVHVAEPGFGVAVANDATYGHDITRSTRETAEGGDGGTTTLVRQSLLRAPTFPDPQADQGRHVLRSSVRVAPDVLDAATAGYRMNLPVRRIEGSSGAGVAPLVSSSSPAVLVEAVKLAEDRSGDLIVRLYEARGARAATTVTVDADSGFGEAWRTDLIERELASGTAGAGRWASGSAVELTLRPFEIVTLRVARA